MSEQNLDKCPCCEGGDEERESCCQEHSEDECECCQE